MLLEVAREVEDAVPGGHDSQKTACPAPILFDQNPAAQGMQNPEPVLLYVPMPHGKHCESSFPPVTLLKVPAGHWAQSETDVVLIEGL